MALASNSVRETVNIGRTCQLTDFLEFTLSIEDASKSKPDPEIYNLLFIRWATAKGLFDY